MGTACAGGFVVARAGAMSTSSFQRIFRVRRTVQQMLRDRGYMISEEDINKTQDAFKEEFSENPPRESLTMLVQKRDDPTDQVFVFWPSDTKVGVKPIKRYMERMNEDDVKRAILIVQQSMTAFAKQTNNPVARYYGLSRGQVVKIVRPSETAGKYVTY